MPPATFDEVLDAVEHLPLDEQIELIDVVRRRLSESGRRRVIDDVREAELHFERGSLKAASVDDLMREIES
jgi:hypothetical protein